MFKQGSGMFKRKKMILYILAYICPSTYSSWVILCHIKEKIFARRTNEVINLKKENGREVIGEIAGSIERIAIIRIRSNFISKLRQIVKEWDSILDLNT